ncbi:hypothetical protein ACM55F_14920 [Flavobacterium sp. XS2P12]|uniref:hypothetical protein n=1 Tax=Flavobacterium melibiosi TaxID=3398734 RepID=UPI003A848416
MADIVPELKTKEIIKPKMKKLTLLIGISLIVTSCVTNKYISKNVKATEITEIKYFAPLSYVSLIEKGNKSVLNDSLSSISKVLLDSVIRNNNNFRIEKRIDVNGIKNNIKVNNELSFLIQTIMNNRKLEGVKLTPTIDSIMKSNKQRFAMASVTTGFGRKKGNYGNQVAKGIGVGILTLGMYAPVPIKSSFSLFTIILDSERNEVVYYCKTLPIEKSPTDLMTIEKQYRTLYEGYIYE